MRKSDDVELTFYIGLIKNVICDIYNGTSSSNDSSRDSSTVERRVLTRGIRFLTEELPALGRSVLLGLERGVFDRPKSFSRRKKASALPAFLQGKLKLVFHDSGVILQDPDPYAVQELLQVCFLYYKIDLPFSLEKEDAVLSSFIETEVELQSLSLPEVDDDLSSARNVLSRLFSGFDPSDIRPRHGPGAVSTREKGNRKYVFQRKYESLHQVYPYYSYFIAGGGRECLDRVRWYRQLETVSYGTARVILVPKDSRGPRLISSEPLEYQWIQGGLGRAISSRCEAHPLTRGRVNFTDQGINQELALTASVNRMMSTIDLKDASDRVSVDLVSRIFPDGILRYLLACRSDATVLPDGTQIGLTKYAPMGSALCFPILALTVWALAHSIARRVTGSNDVYVYGDDLIVPNEIFPEIVSKFPLYGLKINVDKSFSNGYFRESCGVDAFHGVKVTPLKVRKRWGADPRCPTRYASYLALANSLFNKGYWLSATYIRAEVRKIYGVIPYGLPDSSYPCIEHDCPATCEMLNKQIKKHRFNQDYQRLEYLVPTLKGRLTEEPIDGWNRLLKDFSESNPLSPDLVAVLRSAKLKRRWCSV